MRYVIDTNIITAIMKNNEKIKRRAQEAILTGDDIFINGLSYYEIKRGLLAKDARKQLQFFDKLCKEYGLVLLDNRSIFDRGGGNLRRITAERGTYWRCGYIDSSDNRYTKLHSCLR